MIKKNLLLGCAIAAVMSSSAYANAGANTPEENEGGLADIIVIGDTKQTENLQDVPTTITAFTAETLTNQGIKEVREIASFTPGFNVRESGNNPTSFAMSMRGQIQVDNIATLEPSVGIYLDDMYIARTYGLNTEMMDVASVQVRKGPQGTLFGRNTSAGAVLIQTADPEFDKLSGSLKATYGRFDERGATAVLNLGLSDVAAIRGAVQFNKRDGYQTDVYTGKKYSDRDTLSGRVKLALRPTESLSLLFSGEWYDGEMTQARQNLFYVPVSATLSPGAEAAAAIDRAAFGGDLDKVAVTQASTYPGAPGDDLFNDIKTQTYMAKATLETSWGEIKWVNGYRKITGFNLVDLDGSAYAGHFTSAGQDLKQYSSELQFTGAAFNDMVDFAAGLTYFKEKGFDFSRSVYDGTANWSQFNGTINNDSYGVYGQASVHATDALTFTGGLRYSIDDKSVINQSGLYVGNGSVATACFPLASQINDPSAAAIYADLVANECRRKSTASFSHLSYTIGADYQVTDNVLVYAKHSNGFRSGSMQLRSLVLTDTTPSQPEVVNEQEVGIKSELFDRRVRLNIAGYHNKVSGAQRSPVIGINGISQTIIESANTETWGVEADLTVNVAEGLDVFASGALLDPKYTSYTGFVATGTTPNQVLTPVDKSDLPFIGIVEKMFVVGANYGRDLGVAKLDLNATYAWQGKMMQADTTLARLTNDYTPAFGATQAAIYAQQAIDALTTRAHGKLNLRAAVAFGEGRNYEIALWGRNVLDARATSYTLLLPGRNYIATSWNEPATYGVTATVKFGN